MAECQSFITLNIDKTNYIIFHPYNKPMKQHITIKINKKAIKEKECIKYISWCLNRLNFKLETSYIKYI